MMKRLFLKVSLATVAAFALGMAAPAVACDHDAAKKDVKAQKKEAPKPADKGEKKASLDTAASTLAAAEDCKCEKGGKGCTCEKGKCHCENCGKKVAAEDCKCEKGGKGCTCEKGKCHCANCGQKKAA